MRKSQIIAYINERGNATVSELSEHFSVAVETIRRDLAALDKAGSLVRVHGGAVSAEKDDVGTPFSDRSKHNIQDKKDLVAQAVRLIFEGAFIGLDASSSSWELAKIMPDIPCTVVTNSINVVTALKHKDNIHVIATGGSYSEKYDAFYGPIAIETLSRMSLDLFFVSCVGFDYDTGVWDSNEYNHQIKSKFVSIAQKTILIADKTKYRKRSLLRICDVSDIDSIITNAAIPTE